MTDVEPYPVRLGSRYQDGKPGQPGKAWRGTVTGFQPPGALDFHPRLVADLASRDDVSQDARVLAEQLDELPAKHGMPPRRLVI